MRQPGGTSPAAPLSKLSSIIRLPPPELLLELEELEEELALEELDEELEEVELEELELEELELEELELDELDEVELELDDDELLELEELVPPQADKSTSKELATVIRVK